MELSTELALLTQKLANSHHQRVISQVWNLYMPMGQLVYWGNPYINTYDSRFQYHPYLSWETHQDIPQPPQEKKLNLEDALAKMENFQAQMATSYHEEAMAELARSQSKYESLRAEMENSQAEISQHSQVQKSHLEEVMNELANSQDEFSNFQAQFMNQTREILQILSE